MSLFILLIFFNFKLAHLYMIRQNGVNLAGGMPNISTYPINNISMTYKYDVSVELNKQETSAVLQYGSSQG